LRRASAVAGVVVVPLIMVAGIAANFGKEILFAHFFGTSVELEVFRLAYALPYLLSQGISPAFVAALMPLLVRESRKGDAAETSFMRRMFVFNLYAVLIVGGLGVATSPIQAAYMAPGYEGATRASLATQTACMWIFFVALSLSLAPRTVLNSKGVFWPGASVGFLVGGSFVAGTVILKLLHVTVWSSSMLTVIAIISGVVVLAVHLAARPQIFRGIAGVRSERRRNDVSLSFIARSLVLASVYQMSGAVPRFIDRAVATGLPQGVVAAVEYSYNLLTVPALVFATSFLTIVYPAWVRSVIDGTFVTERGRYTRQFVVIVLVTFVIGVGLYVWSAPLVHYVYGRGAFTTNAEANTVAILRWQGLGLGAMVAGMLLSQSLMAFQAIGTLVGIAVTKIVIKAATVGALVSAYGLEGLGLSYIASEGAGAVLLFASMMYWLRRYTPPVVPVRTA
jgi:putative peptidoglycan lipid II flippase